MEEKPIALQHMQAVKSTLTDVEAAIESADLEAAKTAIRAHHDALGAAREAYLAQREWTEDPDIQALSGGEDKPPKEEEDPPVGGQP